MLSILIPVYNIDCTKLVSGLQEQCKKSGIPFEILVYDDGSRKSIKQKNAVLRQLFGVSYVEMTSNIGRAAIRNKLGKYSNHKNLLFIDADSRLPNKSFIKNYLPYLGKYPVIYGGRSYTKRKPTNQKRIFHWVYGTRREAIPAKKRNRNPHLNFLSNNFIVKREVFENVKFDQHHTGYGYEDTLLATELKNKSIAIFHTDNPLIHTGLENTDVFLNKTRNALDNLSHLYINNKIIQTRLIRVYDLLLRYKLTNTVFRYLDKRKEKYLASITSEKPSLRAFDLWKLHYFIQITSGL
jgi:hypothetical protein